MAKEVLPVWCCHGEQCGRFHGALGQCSDQEKRQYGLGFSAGAQYVLQQSVVCPCACHRGRWEACASTAASTNDTSMTSMLYCICKGTGLIAIRELTNEGKNEKGEIPELTQKPVLFVDATPDENYPLRILQAYRQDADCMFSDNTSGQPPLNPLLQLMNEDNRKRAAILDRAIALLTSKP